MSWRNPEVFFLLIPLFIIYIYSSFFMRKKNKGTFLYSSLSLFFKNSLSLRAALNFLPDMLKTIALIFLIIAMARPQTFEERVDQTQKGIDIMLVVDISFSMLIKDMGAGKTRLASAKEVVKNFVEGRPNDRIGLIVFAGESFTPVPLTFDHELLQKRIHKLTTLSSIKGGTAIGVALANSVVRMQNSPRESRMIIFLTDGDNNSGFIDPETALQIVRKHKLKVYTIGIGSRSGAFPVKYEEEDQFGRKFYKQVYVPSRINKKLLKKISSQTGGEFFMARSLSSLKDIFKKIDELETYEIKINKWTKKKEHFKRFLIFGFFSYLLSLFLSLTVFFKGI